MLFSPRLFSITGREIGVSPHQHREVAMLAPASSKYPNAAAIGHDDENSAGQTREVEGKPTPSYNPAFGQDETPKISSNPWIQKMVAAENIDDSHFLSPPFPKYVVTHKVRRSIVICLVFPMSVADCCCSPAAHFFHRKKSGH